MPASTTIFMITRAAEARQHGQPFDLGEIGEVAHPQHGGGFAVHRAQDVRGAKVVAVELLVVRAVLLRP